MDRRAFKMSKEELDIWLAVRKKCAVHKCKKDYTRKQKHKKSLVEQY